MTAPGEVPRRTSRRSRSVSTRVLPDPAGAITRAGPAAWSTAASWSGARSASGARRGRRGQAAGLGGPAVHHGRAVARVGRVRWSPVHPQRGAVGRDDVGRARLDDTLVGEASRQLAAVPPDRLAVPGVVGVGPDQELEALAPEGEAGLEGVHRPGVPLRGPQVVGVDGQLHDHGPPVGPGAVEDLDHRRRRRQCRRRPRPPGGRPPTPSGGAAPGRTTTLLPNATGPGYVIGPTYPPGVPAPPLHPLGPVPASRDFRPCVTRP